MPSIKLTSKWIIHFSIKYKPTKLLQDTIEEHMAEQELGLIKTFLSQLSKNKP